MLRNSIYFYTPICLLIFLKKDRKQMSVGNSRLTWYWFHAERAQILKQWEAHMPLMTHLEASSGAGNPKPRTASGSHMVLGCVTCTVYGEMCLP